MTAIVNPPPSSAADEGPGISPLELVQFVWRAARRHPLVCFSVGMLTLALGLAIVSVLPRRYDSTSKIYVSNTGQITLQLTNGRQPNAEATAKDLREIVFNHDNLLSMVREAKLVENWPKTRNWLQRIVDAARDKLRGPRSKQDAEEQLLSMLERSIDVRLEDSASIRFSASWRDPFAAQKLTMLTQRNYIAAKELEELSAITRATSVLEDELRRADEAFEPAVTEFKNQLARLREQAASRQPLNARTPSVAPISVLPPRPAAPPLELTSKLNELRNEERSVLEPWQRRTAELKFQLADLRAVYGPAHPAVVALEAKLRAASAEPVELLDIRQRQAELKANIASFASGDTSRLGAVTGGRAPSLETGAAPVREGSPSSVADEPSLAPARLQLESALHRSGEIQSRLDAARMELAIAQVGFKYRYRQVEPARFWAKPVKPKLIVLRAAAVAAALLLGFLAGAGLELLSGKLVEDWQVKNLGVEVIATVDVRGWSAPASTRPSLPPSRQTGA